MKMQEIRLESGIVLDAKYTYYPGRLATYHNPAEAPEVTIYSVVCHLNPEYKATDKDYEELTQRLLWLERNPVCDF